MMVKSGVRSACGLAVAGLMFLCGCQPVAPTAPGGTTSTTTPASANPVNDGAEENGDLAKLSAEDLAIAKSQKVCPTGGELGSMGVPVKVEVDGKTVFLCCEHCRDPFLKDPAAGFAKIEAAGGQVASTP